MPQDIPKPLSQPVSGTETGESPPRPPGDRIPTSKLISDARELADQEAARIDALHAAGQDEGIFCLEDVAEWLTGLRDQLIKVLDRLEEVRAAAH